MSNWRWSLLNPKLVFFEGFVTSLNFPAYYPNSHDRTQTVEVRKGRAVLLEFVAFDIESHPSCGYDHLTIKDRDGSTLMEKSCGSSGALIIGGKKTNSSLPLRVQSRSNTVYFEFVTDHIVPKAGWRVNWMEFSGDFKLCIPKSRN